MSRPTKAEKEAAAKLEARRAKERERWARRTQGAKGKAYKKKKQAKKAEWQKRNAKKNLEYVQEFYERYGISGREARALGKEGAASVGKGTTTKPSRASRKRDTGSKVTGKKQAGPTQKGDVQTSADEPAPSKRARRPSSTSQTPPPRPCSPQRSAS